MALNAIRNTGLICVLVLVISSCKVTQPYTIPSVNNDSLFKDLNSTDTNSIANLKWNQLFTDPALQQLIARGIQNNPDLRIAYTRIQQAEAYYRQSRAAFFPSLNANTGVSVSKLSEAQGFGIRTSATQYELGISTDWEADIWGKLRSAKRANLAAVLQSEAGARAIQTGIVGNIATYYYQLLALDEQLKITEKTVRNWDTTVITMRALKDAARVTEAAVVQSEAQRYAAEVTIPDLKQSIREIENALSILLGEAPAGVNRTELEDQQIVPELKTGVPAQLLANRPDVQAAELNFRYNFEMTNVARTFFYPTLSITGSAGFSALSFADFLNPASFAARIGGGITQPIFNRRLNKTRLELAEAQQQEALIGFQNTLLTAGREVSDALSLYETANEKILVRTNQMNALEKSVEYSDELLQNGFATYPEVITARQSLLQAELGSVNDHLQRLLAVVNLYRSLGGGWK